MKSTKPKCSLLATKVGWRVKDAAGRMLTVTEIDDCGYRWCDRVGRNRYLQKFTCAGDPLLNAAQNEYAVAVYPPKMPRVKTHSANYATLQRLKAASTAMRLVSEAMRHLGRDDKADEAHGADIMLKDWINGIRSEMMRAVGILPPNPEVCGPAQVSPPTQKPIVAGSVSTDLLGHSAQEV